MRHVLCAISEKCPADWNSDKITEAQVAILNHEVELVQ